MLDRNTFENADKYKTLDYITEKLNEISMTNYRHSGYLCSFIADFNLVCKRIKNIKDQEFSYYVIYLTREHYKKRLEILDTKYDNLLVSYIRNFIFTKLKVLKGENNIFWKKIDTILDMV